MLADLKKTEESINKDLSTFSSNTLKVIDNKLSKLQNQADKSWVLLKETKASVEARTLFQWIDAYAYYYSQNLNQNQLLGSLPRAKGAAFNSFEDQH